MIQFQTRRDDFTKTRLVDVEVSNPLVDNAIRVNIDRFALTANNVTYVVAGDQLGYWQFFPPIGDDVDGWGVMPVWGFGDVTESNVPDIPVGDRLFGYWPPATELTLQPTSISKSMLTDASPHRAKLPPTYNVYRRVAGEPGYDPDLENERMLVWPLYTTGYCLWEALRDEQWYGAQQIAILSASSKTAIGLAYALKDDAEAPAVVGMTSPRNAEFVSELGLYAQTITYDDVAPLAQTPTAFVDMSGNATLLAELYRHLGDNFAHCVKVGLTHWDDARPADEAIAKRSKFFFAPSHIQARMQDIGREAFASEANAFVLKAALQSREWLELQTLEGIAALPAAYDEVCAGRANPREGLIVQL